MSKKKSKKVKEPKKDRSEHRKLLLAFILMNIAWFLLTMSLVMLLKTTTCTPDGVMLAPQSPTFLFTFLIGFFILCLSGMVIAFKYVFST